MNIEQFEYLVEVARTGSVSVSAHNLHVSQSAISKSILRLEQDLGLTLFTRSRTGLVPTFVGKQLISKAHEILGKINEFKYTAEEYTAASPKRIVLATVPMFLSILSVSLEALIHQYPSTEIVLTEKSTKEIIYDVRENNIDLGFIVVNNEVMNEAEMQHEILMEAKTFVCINKNSDLAGKQFLTPEDVINERIVIYNGSIKEWFTYYFDDADSVKYAVTTNNIQTIKSTIEKGTAISFLSELSIINHQFLANGEIVARPLLFDGNELKMQIGWLKLKKTAFATTTKELINNLKKCIESNYNAAEQNSITVW